MNQQSSEVGSRFVGQAIELHAYIKQGRLRFPDWTPPTFRGRQRTPSVLHRKQDLALNTLRTCIAMMTLPTTPPSDPGCSGVAAVEVLSSSGHWIGGYELISFDVDGLVTIHSTHTHDVRRLATDQWRDPREAAVMAAAVFIQG
jgi:hypothetical protein